MPLRPRPPTSCSPTAVDSPLLLFFLSAPKRARRPPSSCAAPTTSCATRWSARCTTPSAWSSGCWSPSRWWLAAAPWRRRCPSTWRTTPLAWWAERTQLRTQASWPQLQPPRAQRFVSVLLQGSREQLAIAEFARSLLIIPKTLAVNAAQDSTDLVAKLRAFHNEAQVNPERKNLKWWVLAESCWDAFATSNTPLGVSAWGATLGRLHTRARP